MSRGRAAGWRPSSAEIEVSVDADRAPGRTGIRVHRRANLALADLTAHNHIPLTSPTRTLVDLGRDLSAPELETAINAADRRELIDPESLRSALAALAGQPGVVRLREVLDRRTFVLGLVVETDGLRYHRTPAQQARDRRRDQAHTAAGLTPLRFTHADVVHQPNHVRSTLARVMRRLTSHP
jgi:Protein of unknown function (DUF559)